MSKTNIVVPDFGDKFIDLRDTLLGDAYNWSWERDLSAIKYLAIHHSATPDDQTPSDIADFHINTNGWGGIGYHFLISKAGEIFYVGDISTARANVANLNEQVIGICLIGNFTSGNTPGKKQLESTGKLCEYLINLPEMEALNSLECVLGHKELPGQVTICPGDNWDVWKKEIFLKGVQPANEGEIVFNPLQQVSMIQESEDEIAILKSQIDNLQTSLAAVNQQNISLQENLQEKDLTINELNSKLSEKKKSGFRQGKLSILGELINLYSLASFKEKM